MKSGLFLSHVHVSHACRSAVSSLVKSTTKLWATLYHYEHNERSLAPQVHTQSAPGPAPLPPLSHTPHTHIHTMATPEPGVPPCNSITQRHTPVLIPSERKERQRWQEKKLYPLGRDGGKRVKHKRCKCVWGGCGHIRERDTYCKVGQLFWCVSLLVSRVLSFIIWAFEVHINENIKVEKLSATCGILWNRPA